MAAAKSRRLKPPEGESSHPWPSEGRFHSGHRKQEHHKHASRKVEPNVTLLHQPDDHESSKALKVIVRKMSRLPKFIRNLLTWGQGSGVALDAGASFYDPHSQRQRGANESANDLLRQHFPKDADLKNAGPSIFPEKCPNAVVEKLNKRPFMTLGGTLSKIFPEPINGSLKALQTIANSGEQYIDDRQNPSRVHRRYPSREPSDRAPGQRRRKKLCDAAAGKPSRDAKGRRRRAQRRSWGRNLSQTRKRPAGGGPPAGLSRRYRKAPSASATPCPPAASRCSTLGEGGLNCRVRDGTG